MHRRFIVGGIALLVVVAACERTPPTTPSVALPAQMSPLPAPPVPDASMDPIVGRYRLDLEVGPGCESVPAAAKRRSYAAAIEKRTSSPGVDSAVGTAYVVTLGEADFLSGLICTFAPSRLDCNQFLATREAGDALRFDLVNENDDGHGGHIVERLPSGTWIELTGSATGRMQDRDGMITAAGEARIWYCSAASEYPFPCASYVGCRSDDLRLSFTRR